MEHWKRRQMRLNYEWDLTGFEDEEVSRDLNVDKLTNTLSLKNFKDRKPLSLFISSFIFQIGFSKQFNKLQLNAVSIGHWEFSMNPSEKSVAVGLELDHTLFPFNFIFFF